MATLHVLLSPNVLQYCTVVVTLVYPPLCSDSGSCLERASEWAWGDDGRSRLGAGMSPCGGRNSSGLKISQSSCDPTLGSIPFHYCTPLCYCTALITVGGVQFAVGRTTWASCSASLSDVSFRLLCNWGGVGWGAMLLY